jgi:hypothetical protein
VVAARANAATLTNATWSTSSTTDSATGTSYTYSFITATSASLDEITMTVPSGTAGTPSVGTVSPATIAGGSVGPISGGTLTYTFTSVPIIAGEAISVQIDGLTNTGTAGSDTSTITTEDSAGAVDTATTGSVTFTATPLTGPGLSASSTAVGATGTSYTFTFTTASEGPITSVTMTVPPGTSGTPTLGTVNPTQLDGSVTLSGNVLTVSGTILTVLSGTAVTIPVGGLTNTTIAGAYTSEIVAETALSSYAAVTAAVSFTGPLTLTAPGSLTWAITLNGVNQSVADAVTGDKELTVSDETNTGAGWDITISATTFTNGTHTLPNTGTFVLTGSVSSISSSAAPSLACMTSCVPPADAVTYPVAVTTAASPSPVSVYAASAASGLGGVILGSASSADPVGWWLSVPANARAGSYTSTVTVTIASGP